MILQAINEKMGRKLKYKLLKIISLCFTIYICIQLDLPYVISSRIFGPFLTNNHARDNVDSPLQENFLRKWEETNLFFKNIAKRHPEEDEGIQEDCKIPSLKFKIGGHGNLSSSSCKRIKPVSSSCQVARDLFSNKKITDCSHQNYYKFCEVKGDVGSYHVKCDMSLCSMPVSVSNVNPSTGEFVWTELKSSQEVENHYDHFFKPSSASAADKSSKKHFGFSFIKCHLKDPVKAKETSDYDFSMNFQDGEVLQLLVLPPDLGIVRPDNLSSELHKDNININLVFIDSVSRHHFFRSLPRTLKVFEDINQKYLEMNLKKTKLKQSPLVLDFELLQGVKSRTFESLQALFSGYVNPAEKPFGILELPPKPLDTETLLQNFKNLGYETLWLEDLCWQWEWGLSKDLRVHNKSISYKETWKRFMKAIKTAAIDRLDITFASCVILNFHNVKDPFHYADDICFFGRHHHEYIIEYLTYYQSMFQYLNRPYFSLYESNVGHEDTMLRIQQFDKSFSNYVRYVTDLKNTLSIIFSDHGNTYGSFVEKSDEARVEMFHPLLFMIIPPDVQNTLGARAVDAIVQNQQKLVSLLDLHEMIFSISSRNVVNNITLSKPFSKGQNLLGNIPDNRSCEHIPRLMPNLCICQDFENVEKNDSYYAIFALFASSLLNRELQKQYRTNHPDVIKGFGSCRRLMPSEFRNVRTSFGEPKNSVSIKMEIYFKNEINNHPEVFFVAMRMNRNGKGSIQMVTYERITPFSIYEKCADKGVDAKLCICGPLLTHKNATFDQSVFSQEVLSLSVERVHIDPKLHCLFLLVRKSDYGVVIEAASTCKKGVYQLTMSFWKINMITSNLNSTTETVLHGGDITFMIAAVRRNRKRRSDWKYTVDIKPVL